MTTDFDRSRLTRRRILRDAGAGVLGVTAMGTLVACGDGEGADSPGDTTDTGDTSTTPSAPESTEPTDTAADEPTAASEEPPADALASIDDIPVGGAISATSADGSEVILARPSDADVVGFSAVCTHQACIVAPADDSIRCPCHGSVYDIVTGENVSGPAPRPLEPFAVRVEGGAVVES